MHVLIADDDMNIRNLLRLSFLSAGHTVQLASDGPKALMEIQCQPFDAVVMDVNMPGIDGFRATSYIRELFEDKDRKHPVVVIFTALYERDYEMKAIEAGAKYVLDKTKTGLVEVRTLVEQAVAERAGIEADGS